MNFQTFLTDYVSASPGFWTTHKIGMDSSGNVEVKEGLNTEEEISFLFKEKMDLLKKTSEMSFQLLGKVFSILRHFKEDLGIEFRDNVAQYIPPIEVSDGEMDLSYDEYKILRKTPLFRAFSKKISFPDFTGNEIKNYFKFVSEDNVDDDLLVLISIFSFSRYLGDEVTNEKCSVLIYKKLKKY